MMETASAAEADIRMKRKIGRASHNRGLRPAERVRVTPNDTDRMQANEVTWGLSE